MKTLLKLEELAMFLVCLGALILFRVDWWWYLILFVGPDISMLGYLVNNKVGAYCYNLFHHKGVAILIFLLGFSWYAFVINASGFVPDVGKFIATGITLFGHSSMDRFFGFGLKTEEGFKFTHLGKIGKDEVASNL